MTAQHEAQPGQRSAGEVGKIHESPGDDRLLTQTLTPCPSTVLGQSADLSLDNCADAGLKARITRSLQKAVYG